MLARLLALMLLLVALAAAADPAAPALPAHEAADWKALACAVLVALHIAWRRSRWLAD